MTECGVWKDPSLGGTLPWGHRGVLAASDGAGCLLRRGEWKVSALPRTQVHQSAAPRHRTIAPRGVGHMRLAGIRAAALAVVCAGMSLVTAACSVSVNVGSGPSATAASPGLATRSSPSATPTSSVSAGPNLVTVTLPVTVVPTSYGVGSGSPPPATVTLTLPAADQGRLGAYFVGVVVLAPAGWAGSAAVGADGSIRAALYPPGGSASAGPRELVQEDSACQACGADDGAAYFPAVHKNWTAYGWPFSPPPLLAFQRTDYLSPDTLAYSLPNTPSGLAVNGVAYSGVLADNPGLTFADLRVYLPPSETALATVILNDFVQRDL